MALASKHHEAELCRAVRVAYVFQVISVSCMAGEFESNLDCHALQLTSPVFWFRPSILLAILHSAAAHCSSLCSVICHTRSNVSGAPFGPRSGADSLPTAQTVDLECCAIACKTSARCLTQHLLAWLKLPFTVHAILLWHSLRHVCCMKTSI